MEKTQRTYTDEEIRGYLESFRAVACHISVREFTHKANIPLGTFYGWKRKWEDEQPLGLLMPRMPKYSHVEDSLYAWFVSERQKRLVPRQELQEKALEIAAVLDIPDFKASSCWLTNFLKRKALVIRTPTPVENIETAADLSRRAMDLAEPENSTSASGDKSSKPSSLEVMVTFVFRHELTDGAAERHFPKELFEKVQEVRAVVKNGRKEIMLALDPYSIVIGDIKGFLLEEYGMKSVSDEKNEEMCIAQMIMLADAKVVLDSDKIFDLIIGGDLKKVPSPKGDKYILTYIFLRPNPKLSTPAQQQKAIDALLKNLSTPPSSSPPIPVIRPPTFSPSTISPSSSRQDISPEPDTQQTPVTSSPNPPETEVEKVVAPEAKSANSTLDGGGQDTGRKKRGRTNQEQAGSPEIPVRERVAEPDAKRLRPLVPNVKVTAKHGQTGSGDGGGVQQIGGSNGGVVTVGNVRNPMFPLATNPAPFPLPYPLMPIPPLSEYRPVQTVPQVPRSPNRRWTFSAQELAVMSHLAVGHKKVTITFEDDNGTSQTICVENRQ